MADVIPLRCWRWIVDGSAVLVSESVVLCCGRYLGGDGGGGG